MALKALLFLVLHALALEGIRFDRFDAALEFIRKHEGKGPTIDHF